MLEEEVTKEQVQYPVDAVQPRAGVGGEETAGDVGVGGGYGHGV